jgi:hypothetical protein
VQSTDRLTLVAEVISEPPARLEWFCDDIPVAEKKGGRTAAMNCLVRHAPNISTLTVEASKPHTPGKKIE